MKALVALAALCSTAYAWKPETHVYLAKQAYDDALDGSVTIYRLTGGNACSSDGHLQVLGTYEVDPQIVTALRDHPDKYFAGVLGPDAYPDIVSGQMRIHPPGPASGDDANAYGPGTDPWLQQLWNRTWAGGHPDSAQLAWTLGFLDHAAGDIFAHTFMNTFAGGIFNLTTMNGIRHVTLEGYLEERTPRIGTVQFQGRARDVHEIVAESGITGLENFIADALADVPGSDPREAHKSLSVPYLLATAERALTQQVAAFDAFDQQLHHDRDVAAFLGSPAGAPAALAWACSTSTQCPDASIPAARCPYSRGDKACATLVGGLWLWSLGQAGLAATLQAAIDGLGPARLFIQSQRERRDAVHRARIAWVRGSHAGGAAIFFTASRSFDRATFDAAYAPFKRELPDTLLGAPPPIASGLIAIHDALGLPSTLVDAQLRQIEQSVFAWAFQQVFHLTVDQAKELYTRPHIYLNGVFDGSTPGISLVSANQIMHLPRSSAHCQVVATTAVGPVRSQALVDATGACDLVTGAKPATFTAEPRCGGQAPFEPAMNTVTMIKLSMLSQRGLAQLQRDLHIVDGTLAGSPWNLMLGFAATIDGSHQWGATRDGLTFGPRPMMLARDCAAFATVFADQRPAVGERVSPRVLGAPWEPDYDHACHIVPTIVPVAIATTPAEPHVRYGSTIRIAVNQRVDVGHPTAGSIEGTTTGTAAFTYRAPTMMTAQTTAEIVLTASDGRSERIRIQLEPALELAVHLDVARVQPSLAMAKLAPVKPGATALVGDPAVPMAWTIAGAKLGEVGDAKLHDQLVKQLASLTSPLKPYDAQLATERDRAKRTAILSARDQALLTVIAAAKPTLGKLVDAERTFHAPAKLDRPTTVKLHGTALDGSGRTADVTIELTP